MTRASIDSNSETPAAADDFRIASAFEIAAMLRQLRDDKQPMSLSAGDGQAYASTIWSIDRDRCRMAFWADADDPAVQPLLACQEVQVSATLDGIRLYFSVRGLVLVRGYVANVLSATAPREMFRLQRRDAYRVRPLLPGVPMTHCAHLQIAGVQTALRVIDVSSTGCALLIGADAAAPVTGIVLDAVEIDLDADTRFHMQMRLQYVTTIDGPTPGQRLGFEFVHAGGAAMRALQRFIDRTQKRGKLLGIE